MGEIIPAQGFGRNTSLHASYRAFQSTDETGTVDSAIQSVELRRRKARSRFMLRLGYRWYQDSTDVTAEGPSAGFDFSRGERTFGLFYRQYENSDGLNAGSAWFSFRSKF